MSGRRVTFDNVLFHDCSIHMDCSVEHALDLSNAQVDEIFAIDSDLSITVLGATCRDYFGNGRLIIVKESS